MQSPFIFCTDYSPGGIKSPRYDINAHKQNSNNIINSPPAPTNLSDEVPGPGHEAGRTSVQLTEQRTIQNSNCKRRPEFNTLVVSCTSNLTQPRSVNTKEKHVYHTLSGKPRRKHKTKKRSDPAQRKKWSHEDNITLILAY